MNAAAPMFADSCWVFKSQGIAVMSENTEYNMQGSPEEEKQSLNISPEAAMGMKCQ